MPPAVRAFLRGKASAERKDYDKVADLGVHRAEITVLFLLELHAVAAEGDQHRVLRLAVLQNPLPLAADVPGRRQQLGVALRGRLRLRHQHDASVAGVAQDAGEVVDVVLGVAEVAQLVLLVALDADERGVLLAGRRVVRAAAEQR
jgi:hypothetical protein